MTAEHPADVTALTQDEKAALVCADVGNDLYQTVETIIAARTAIARAEGYEAGRAEVTAAVEALVHEDWCCARGCAGYGFCEGCDGTEADCRCMKSIFRATLAAATTAYGGP